MTRWPPTQRTWVAIVTLAVLVAVGAAWWWQSTAPDRGLRTSIDQEYNQCLAQAAASPDQGDTMADECSAERDAMLKRLGL
jgi:acyl carrier protein phosphodiesterase